MVFCLVGGKVAITAYLNDYVIETKVMDDNMANVIVFVLWASIAIGRVIGNVDGLYISIYLTVSVCLSVSLSLFLSLPLFVCLSIYLSIYLSIFLSMSTSLYFFFTPSLPPSLPPCPSLPTSLPILDSTDLITFLQLSRLYHKKLSGVMDQRNLTDESCSWHLSFLLCSATAAMVPTLILHPNFAFSPFLIRCFCFFFV